MTWIWSILVRGFSGVHPIGEEEEVAPWVGIHYFQQQNIYLLSTQCTPDFCEKKSKQKGAPVLSRRKESENLSFFGGDGSRCPPRWSHARISFCANLESQSVKLSCVGHLAVGF